MAKLNNRRVLVVGASGGVGEGITRVLLREGATVAAAGRSPERLSDLAGHLDQDLPGSLETHVLDVTSDDAGAQLAELGLKYGRFDAAVISIGDPGNVEDNNVLTLNEADVLHMFQANELGGLRALQAVVPAVVPEGAVFTLLGFSSEAPFPHNPLMGSTNAALRSLVSTLSVQLERVGPRVHGLVLGVVRTRERQKAGIDNPKWLTGEQVGERIVEMIATPTAPGISHILDDHTAAAAKQMWSGRDA